MLSEEEYYIIHTQYDEITSFASGRPSCPVDRRVYVTPNCIRRHIGGDLDPRKFEKIETLFNVTPLPQLRKVGTLSNVTLSAQLGKVGTLSNVTPSPQLRKVGTLSNITPSAQLGKVGTLSDVTP